MFWQMKNQTKEARPEQALEKHFIKDYNAHAERLRKQHGSDYMTKKVMGHLVGGHFDAVGQVQADLLRMHGLADGMALADISCGSGRTAYALSKNFRLGSYFGTDIVKDMLDFARTFSPAEYHFELVDGLAVPASDNTFDIACAFSLFTHLLHEETFIYLEDIRRVLKPGGKLVFSFLEFAMPHHWNVFEATKRQVQAGTRIQLNAFLERNAIEAMAAHLQFDLVCYQDSTMGDYVRLSRPVDYEDGRHAEEGASLGQSVCVLRKQA